MDETTSSHGPPARHHTTGGGDHAFDLNPETLVSPRWKKVLGDLWGNKVRTLLVVLSIFIGVFAVGMIAGSQAVLLREMQQGYRRTSPAHATISTGGAISYNEDMTMDFRPSNDQGFSQDLVDVVRNMDEVADAEGRRPFNVRLRVGDDWKSMQITAINDFDDMRVNKIRREAGTWPPGKREILIERSGMPMLDQQIGDTIVIERPDGKQRELTIAGVVHDVSEWPTPFLSMYYGYVTFDTIEWLGQPRTYSSMLLRVAGDASNQEHNKVVAREVYDKIRKSGLDPSFPKVPEPDRPPTEFIISAITSLMGLLGLFAILLSGFLVTNTISALLAQQIKQIGMMKAVGARATQIMTIYIVLVLCFGILALIPAIPLSQAATSVFSGYLSAFLNFDIANGHAPAYVIILQVAIGLIVPVVAALIPIYSGTRITIREALSNIGRSSGYGSGFIDRAIQHIRGLPRPLLLSLRNSFRRKGRVALTLATLTLAGAFFISVFSVKASLEQTIEEIIHSVYAYDLNVYLDRNYRIETLQHEASKVPGVVQAEAMVQTSARRIHTDNPESRNVLPDDREGANTQLSAISPDTQTIQPILIAGRWLLPDDENALVISSGMLHEDPDIQVGDEIVLRVKDEKTRWYVVGIMQGIGEARWAYTNLDYYSRLVGEVGQSGYLRVVTEGHTIEEQLATAKRLEEHFQQRSLDVSSTQSMAEMSEGDTQMIAMITASLMFMAMLVAVVGSLGLAGMMTLNVIERVREIGIMRAIGASDTSILQIFIVEGVIIGLVSWSLGALLAMPVARGLSTALGMMLVSAPLSFNFSVDGIVVWLVLSFGMAAVASFVPAWRATRVSVRDVLAYE